MTLRLTKLLSPELSPLWKPLARSKSQRFNLGKPPGVARTLQQRLEEINYKDPKLHYKVDIGLPFSKQSRKEVTKEQVEILKKIRTDPQYELLARERKLYLDLNEVRDVWQKTLGPLHLKRIADHFEIFDHLFGDAYFIPSVPLSIGYDLGENSAPVYNGNSLKPAIAEKAPEVSFSSSPDSLWTLVLTTPDGNLTSEGSEYVHWFIGNIKGNDISSGETIWDYLQPFPMYGTGFFRYIFILYKQEGPIDYSALKKSSPCLDLAQRTFKTYDFYRDRQDLLTPAGLAFFQADWDESVTKVFHEKFQKPEPKYEYDFDKPYHRKQEWFPLRRPFNLYLDRYRDEKQIAKEFLCKKLKRVHPFKEPEPPLKYPNAIPFKWDTPSWLKNEIRKERLRWGRINDY